MADPSSLSGGLGSAGGADIGASMAGLASSIQDTGGIDGLLTRLRAGGLGAEVDSWFSNGPNREVDPQRLGAALGPDMVQQLSNGAGIDVGALLPLLAAFLPQLVHMLTPSGQSPSGGLDEALRSGGLGDLGGLLGGLMGGSSGGAAIEDVLGGLGGLLGGDKGR